MLQPTCFQPVFPKRLQPGDTIAVISTSGPTRQAALWDAGLLALEQAGYQVVIASHARKNIGYLAGTDAERLADLHWAFSAPEVDGILCARGGYGAMRLLPDVDWALMAQHPKVFIGFSDLTALLLAFWQKTGLVGFYGPMLTSNLCHDEPYSLAQLLKMIQGDVSPLQPIDNLNEYHCLKPGIARGRLIGGNFSLLAALCGTPYQPDTRGALLFIEDWHESPYSLDRKYQQLKLAGVLDELAGLILCDFSEMEDDPGFFNPEGSAQARTWREFWTMLTADLNIPVGLGFSVGHGAQTATLPIGAMAQWDTATGQLALLDRPVLG